MNSPLNGGAYLVAGTEELLPGLYAYLEEHGVACAKNSDVYVRTYQHFGIEEARDIIERAACRAIDTRRVFIVVVPDMTHEAQNAFLKTIEEPVGDALFFFVIPSPETLISTIRSRAQMMTLDTNNQVNIERAMQFLDAEPQKRLTHIASLIEKKDDERRDVNAIVQFLASLEHAVARRTNPDHQGIAAIYRARRYLTDKGALIKPLLEQVALLVGKM